MSKFTSKIIIRKSRINNGNVSRRINSNVQQILLVLLMEHIHKLWESLECFLVVSEDTTTIKGINITPLDILHTEIRVGDIQQIHREYCTLPFSHEQP